MAFTCRNLKEAERKELANWLKPHNLELDGHIRYKLTDVVPVAKMFKRIYPKLIYIHHYNKGSDFDQKLQNWKIFNEKVLTKLGLGLSSLALDDLAKGHVGAIESLLHNLISMSRSNSSTSKQCSQKLSSQRSQKKAAVPLSRSLKHSLTHIPMQARIALTPPEVLSIDVEQLNNGKIVKEPKQFVAYEDYLEALRECKKKESYMHSVRHKSQYLESLTKVKDERIEDLMKQLERLKNLQAEICN